MKVILKSQTLKIANELLDIISSTIMAFESITADLEDEFGNEILNKKIGEGFRDGEFRYSLRDRYGGLCDQLLNCSLTIAKLVGVEESGFRKAVDERIGNSRIYDGEYDMYFATEPSIELLELDKGSKRWWKPSKMNEK